MNHGGVNVDEFRALVRAGWSVDRLASHFIVTVEYVRILMAKYCGR